MVVVVVVGADVVVVVVVGVVASDPADDAVVGVVVGVVAGVVVGADVVGVVVAVDGTEVEVLPVVVLTAELAPGCSFATATPMSAVAPAAPTIEARVRYRTERVGPSPCFGRVVIVRVPHRGRWPVVVVTGPSKNVRIRSASKAAVGRL